MHKFILFLLIWICFIPSAFAKQRVAVLEFKGIGLDEGLVHKLSDQTRRAAAETLPQSGYIIMTRENMMMILKDMGKDASCMGGSCEVELGRNIGADIIVTGNVMKIDEHYSLTLTLYKTQDGSVLRMKEIYDETLLDLVKQTYVTSISLFQDGLNISAVEQNEGENNTAATTQTTQMSGENETKVANLKNENPPTQKDNQKYKWVSMGFLGLSGLSYGVSYATHEEYFNTSDEGKANNIFLLNQTTSVGSLVFLGLSGGSYILGQMKSKEE